MYLSLHISNFFFFCLSFHPRKHLFSSRLYLLLLSSSFLSSSHPSLFFFCFFCCFFLLAPFLLCKPSLCGGTCTSCSNIDLWRRTGACDFSVGCCRRRETNTSTGEAAGSEKLYVLICDSRAGSPSGTREFLYVFFLPIFFITCVCPVSSNVALWIQKSISLATLLLSVQLILCPAIQPFYSLDVFSLLLPLHFCALFFVPRSN